MYTWKSGIRVLLSILLLFKLKEFVLSKLLHSVRLKARHIRCNSYRNKLDSCAVQRTVAAEV